MKVLNLRCSHIHSFEGWFGSEDDFQNQLRHCLVACPMCADTSIQKMPSAPRLNFGSPSGREDQCAAVALSANPGTGESACIGNAEHAVMPEPGHAAAQAAFSSALRQVMAATEDMGTAFAAEARRMHYGEVQPRAIRGRASMREAVELLEEGIEVMSLPIPLALMETLQ